VSFLRFASGQRLNVFFCHSDPERSEGEESHPFFYNRNEFLRFAQDDASGDLPPRNDKKGHSFADPSHKLRALAQGLGSGQSFGALSPSE